MGPEIGRIGVADVVLAGAFAVGAAVEAVVRFDGDLADLVLTLSGALAMAVLLVRRSRPLLAMSVFCLSGAVASVIQAQLSDQSDDAFVPVLTLIVLSFALGTYAGRRDLLLGAPQPLVLVLGVDLLDPGQTLVGAAIFVSLFVVLLPVSAGRLVRSRRQLVTELHALEAAVGRDHEQRLRMVRAQESLAVARMLNQTLESGLEELLGTEDIEEVEDRARSLLETTRDAVVSLARDHDEVTRPGQPATRVGRSREAPDPNGLTWTAVVAAAIGAGLLTETSSSWSHPVPGLVLTAAVVAAIVSMARHPLAGALVAWAAATLASRTVVPLGDTFTAIGLTVAAPFLASWLADRRRGAVAVVAGLGAAVLGIPMSDPGGALVLTVFAAVAGGILRDRSGLLADVRAARAEAAERRREELRIAALEERAVLGRELHDSIGHALTVVALQAGAARRLKVADPVAAAGARDTIERTARQALEELRRGFEAVPGTVAGLVSNARSAGLEVTVDGPAPPPELEGVVFRVVQEALTNVLRHAPGAQVRVQLGSTTGGAAYLCSVSNTVPQVSPTTYPSAGRGLAGMRRRLESIGGTVSWGPTEAGFAVAATFPRSGEVAR
jgi:signal transduction histidine kinase